MMIDFGDKIKNLRLSKTMTQADLARRLGITKSMISAYESGTRQPSYETLVKLAAYFNVTMDYLFGFKGERYIDVSGLTEQQCILMNQIVTAFKDANGQNELVEAYKGLIDKDLFTHGSVIPHYPEDIEAEVERKIIEDKLKKNYKK